MKAAAYIETLKLSISGSRSQFEHILIKFTQQIQRFYSRCMMYIIFRSVFIAVSWKEKKTSRNEVFMGHNRFAIKRESLFESAAFLGARYDAIFKMSMQIKAQECCNVRLSQEKNGKTECNCKS